MSLDDDQTDNTVGYKKPAPVPEPRGQKNRSSSAAVVVIALVSLGILVAYRYQEAVAHLSWSSIGAWLATAIAIGILSVMAIIILLGILSEFWPQVLGFVVGLTSLAVFSWGIERALGPGYHPLAVFAAFILGYATFGASADYRQRVRRSG